MQYQQTLAAQRQRLDLVVAQGAKNLLLRTGHRQDTLQLSCIVQFKVRKIREAQQVALWPTMEAQQTLALRRAPLVVKREGQVLLGPEHEWHTCRQTAGGCGYH